MPCKAGGHNPQKKPYVTYCFMYVLNTSVWKHCETKRVWVWWWWWQQQWPSL